MAGVEAGQSEANSVRDSQVVSVLVDGSRTPASCRRRPAITSTQG